MAAMAKGQTRPVSVTLGSVEYRNWQDNLVKGNPNLKHFHWNPIYSNIQGVKMVKPMPKPPLKGTTPPRKHERNKKTAKNSPNVHFKPVAHRPSFYKRTNPVHVMPRHTERTSTDYTHVTAGELTRRDINGKLMLPVPEPDTATTAELRRQKDQLDFLSGKLMPPKDESQMALAGKLKIPTQAKRNVSGQLMTSKVEGELVARSLNGELVGKPSVDKPVADKPQVDKSLTRYVDKNTPSTLSYGNYDSQYATGFANKQTLTKSAVNGKVTHRARNY